MPDTEVFWQKYLESLDNADGANRLFYEVFRVGDTDTSAVEGARLIKQGIKTATSTLLWEYQAACKPLPEIGSLSIVEEGKDKPVCIVETIEVEIKQFADVDERFAYDYGEWDRTLKCWRRHCWEYYVGCCDSLQKAPAEDMPLVCERLRVIYP